MHDPTDHSLALDVNIKDMMIMVSVVCTAGQLPATRDRSTRQKSGGDFQESNYNWPTVKYHKKESLSQLFIATAYPYYSLRV